MLKKNSFFSRIAALLFGMALLIASSPVKAETMPEEEIAAPGFLWSLTEGETAGRAEPDAEWIGPDDWWTILRPDTDGIEVNVVSTVKEEPEEDPSAVEVFGVDSGTVRPEDTDASEVELPKQNTVVKEELVERYQALEEGLRGGRTLTMAKTTKLSAAELDSLQRIVESEAGNEDIMGRILVANVVLNRYHSELFPNTIEGVVTQTSYGSYGLVYQFTPAKPNGRYWSASPSKGTVEAVERALSGEDYSEGAMYFAARQQADANHMSWFDRKLTRLFRHGNHEFYK